MFCRISCWRHHPFSYNGPLTTPVKTLWKHPKNRERLPNRYVKWANNVVQEDMLNVPAILLQCSIDQMFSMFHRKTFMVNLAKTFNKNMESVPAWNMQRVGIDRIDLNRPNAWNRSNGWNCSNHTRINHQMRFAKRCEITILVKVLWVRDSIIFFRLILLDRICSHHGKAPFYLTPMPKSGRASHLCLPPLNHFIIWYKISPFPTWFGHSKWRRIQTRSGLFLRPGWS